MKTAMLIVLMMKTEDDLYLRKMGAFCESSFLHKRKLRKKVVITCGEKDVWIA